MKRLLVVLAMFVAGSLPSPAVPPNIIFILTDDLGATDLGCFGSQFYQTPNIDRLAHDGLKFTHAYSACTVCSPTRAALMTGRSPAALHLTDWITGHDRPSARLRIPDWSKNLPHDVPTLPQALHAAGYTTGCIGKWHLGDDGPEKYGFDVAIANNGKGQPASYFSPYKNPQLPDGPPGEFLTDRLTAEAEKFIEQHQDHPFFLYLPHYAVHTPLMGKPEVVEKYRQRASANDPQHHPTYAALVESVDDSVGRLRAKLDALKLSERTIIVFTSDNGGLILNQVTSNLGLRAGKGSAYEGGVRVPAIALVPGMTKAGSTSTAPVITMDWTATLLELAGAQPLSAAQGVSLTPLLRGRALPPRPIFWHYPHYHPGGATPYSAVLDEGWRLVEFFEDDRAELYALGDDPMEQHDLAALQPQKTAELRAKLQAWRESVGAQLPTPNPDYDPAKDAQPPKRKKAPEQ
jgi:arylsulfatase A-like enzyme